MLQTCLQHAQHLPVHVVLADAKKQKRANDPAESSHTTVCCRVGRFHLNSMNARNRLVYAHKENAIDKVTWTFDSVKAVRGGEKSYVWLSHPPDTYEQRQTSGPLEVLARG